MPETRGVAGPAPGMAAQGVSNVPAVPLLGSVANLIVAEQARAQGTPISFWACFKVGLPLTLITLAAGTWRLMKGSGRPWLRRAPKRGRIAERKKGAGLPRPPSNPTAR